MGVGEDVYIHTCGCVCLYQIVGVELMYGGVEIDEGVCMCARELGCVCMCVCVCVCVCVNEFRIPGAGLVYGGVEFDGVCMCKKMCVFGYEWLWLGMGWLR